MPGRHNKLMALSSTGFSIRIKVGGRNVEVGSEGVTGTRAARPSRGVRGHAPPGNF